MKKQPQKNKKNMSKGGVNKQKHLKFKASKKNVKKTKKARVIKKTKPKVKIVKKSIKKHNHKTKESAKLQGRRKAKKVNIIKPRIYIGKGLLEQLFESQPKVKILKFFFRNYQDSFTLKELFRRLRTNEILVRKELSKLEKTGLIKEKKTWLSVARKRGGIKKEQKIVYFINTGFDFFNELKNLILKSTIASKDELVADVKKIGNIKVLALSGIFTGDETSKADILIVGDKINSRKLNTFIKDLEAEVGKELNCASMSTREFNYRYDMYDRFVRDLLAGKSEILISRINL